MINRINRWTHSHLSTRRRKIVCVAILFIAFAVCILVPVSFASMTQTNDLETSTTHVSTLNNRHADISPTSETGSAASPDSRTSANSGTPSKNTDGIRENNTATAQTPSQKSNSFTISTTKNVTLAAGDRVGPFTAITSDGTKVSWTTPYADTAGSPYGYVNDTSSQASSSYTYYIRAEESVKAGTYTLFISAFGGSPATRASATLSVTVLPRPYYTLTTSQPQYNVTADQRILKIPYTINRYNGYSGKVTVTSNVQHAPVNNYGYYVNIFDSNDNGGYITFDASQNGFSEGTYTVSLNGYDAVSSTITSTYLVNVDY